MPYLEYGDTVATQGFRRGPDRATIRDRAPGVGGLS